MHGGRAAELRAVLVAARRLPVTDTVDVGDGADRLALVDQRALGAVDELRELWQRDDSLDALAELADLGLVGVEPGRDHDGPDLSRDHVVLALDADLRDVVAEAARLGHQLGVGVDGDRRPLRDLGNIGPSSATPPPRVDARSTMTTPRPMSASPMAARSPATPPPTTIVLGSVLTTSGSRGVDNLVLATPALTRPIAFSVAPSWSSV